jgi:hypothetical protein
MLFTPKFKFFLFSFFLELQFSIFSNLKNLKKIQRKIFFQLSANNFRKNVFMVQFFEKKQNKDLFFYKKTFMINLQKKTKKDNKNNERKFIQKEKNCFVQNFSKNPKLSKKIFFFVFSWVFAVRSKNFYFANLPLEKLPNFQIEKTNSLKNLQQNDVSKKNLFFIKQKNKQKISFGSLKKVFSQSFDLKQKYSQISALNSLNLFKNIIELFDSFLNFIFLNLSKHWNHFQMIYHQYLKFHFFHVQTQLQKNQFWFANFFFFEIDEQPFFCFFKTKLCLSDLHFLHLIPQNYQKPVGFFTEQNLQIFQQKNFQKTFSFFLNSLQKEKTRVENFIFLKTHDFEKSYFHLYQSIDAKKLKKKFFFFFVFLLKKNCLTVQKFFFQNSAFQNFQKKPIFLLWKKYFSNFLFYNSRFLFFFKNSYFLKKTLLSIGNFLFLKNSSYAIYLKQKIEQKEILKKNFSGFFPKPFFPRIIQTQKERPNRFYEQNIFWLVSKKFFYYPTKIQKLEFFHFSPFFSDFLILYKKSMPLFWNQTPQTKSFLSFVDFFNQHLIQLGLNSQKKQKKTHVFLKEKKFFFIHQKKDQLQKKNKKLFFEKMFKTNLFFEHKKQQIPLFYQKKRKKIFFQNSFFQSLNFNCFSVSLELNTKKQLKYFYNFEKKPTYENIQNHLNECKQMLKKSIGQKQLNFMKKLYKKIQNWSKKYNTNSSKKIFEYCDSILLKFLWNWARKTHPNKSKGWIRKKYFHLIYSQKWFFGKKIGKIFICLPLHSQINLK